MNDWAEFRHFKYLLAIAEHKGFRAAAEYLHTAQPNLSAQAKQFQDFSEVHLFRKGRKSYDSVPPATASQGTRAAPGMLAEGGLKIGEYLRASHPTEIQELVKQGYGFALIRQGTVLDTELITRPIVGLTGLWTPHLSATRCVIPRQFPYWYAI